MFTNRFKHVIDNLSRDVEWEELDLHVECDQCVYIGVTIDNQGMATSYSYQPPGLQERHRSQSDSESSQHPSFRNEWQRLISAYRECRGVISESQEGQDTAVFSSFSQTVEMAYQAEV